MRMITDKYLIREQNEALVLQTIIENKGLSRAQIAKETGLNKASVSSITTSLIDSGLVEETGIGQSGKTGGRKPIFVNFCGKAGLVIAFDLGYNYISGAISYLDGTIIRQFREGHLLNRENIIDYIEQYSKELLSAAPLTLHDVVGMTLAIHGIVVDNHIRFTPSYDLKDFPLKKELEKRFYFPIYLENEANLSALGEFTFSQSRDNLISISIHSGIGAGIIQDKRLQTGAYGQAGEIGHTILHPKGKACNCGNLGCLEKYASNLVVYQEFSKHYNLKHANSDLISQYYLCSDSFTQELINQQIYHQAIGINNLIMLCDPQLVIINSSLYAKIPKLLDKLESEINSQFAQKVSLTISNLGDTATLYGGIATAVQQFLHIPDLTFPR